MPDPDRSSPSRRLWIVALCTLWIAQPLYDLVGGTSLYFLVRGLASSDVWLFALLAFLLPPAALIVLAELAGAIGHLGGRPGVRNAAYAGIAAALSALGALLVTSLAGDSWGVPVPARLALSVAMLVMVLAVRLLRRQAMRQILVLIAYAAPLAPVLFYLRPEVRGELLAPPPPVDIAARPAAGTVPPVVLVVLDELPLTTLLDARGEIDDALFPRLAELAATSGWYRGAKTPRYFTQHAVPALVAGRLGEERRLATVRGYPQNLLTLLRASHRVLSDEPITALDPERPLAPRAQRLAAMAFDGGLLLARAALPGRLGAHLPESALRLPVRGGGDPTDRFEAFLERVDAAAAHQDSRRPLLVFSHLLLPHHPWLRDESGALYDGGDEILIDGLEEPAAGALKAVWRDDWEAVLDAYERHVLQTRHADRLVGEMMDLLRRRGLFEAALVIVAADHGIHFAPAEPPRRSDDGNGASLARVPLLVKLPGQKEGYIDDSPRSTLDVLPTVLDLLGAVVADGRPARVALELPGSSLLEPARGHDPFAGAPAPYEELRERWLLRQGVAGPDGFGPWHERLAGLRLRPGGLPTRDWVADVPRAGRIETVDGRLPLPRRLSGRLLPRRPEVLARLLAEREAVPLAVAVDGVVVASTWTSVPRDGDEHVAFSVLLPAMAVAPGEHQLGLYLPAFDGDLVLPQPIPRLLEPSYRLAGDRLLDAGSPSGAQWPLAPAGVAAAPTGEVVALHWDGIDAAREIFGRVAVPDGGQVEEVLVFLDGRQVARAEWLLEGEPGGRYRVGSAGGGMFRLFRAAVPEALDAGADTRVVVLWSEAKSGERRAAFLPLRQHDESLWRVTGPFPLTPDPRRPFPAFQNF